MHVLSEVSQCINSLLMKILDKRVNTLAASTVRERDKFRGKCVVLTVVICMAILRGVANMTRCVLDQTEHHHVCKACGNSDARGKTKSEGGREGLQRLLQFSVCV